MERYSIPFFYNGSITTVVTCLPGFEGETGPKYPPITVGDYVTGKMRGIFDIQSKRADAADAL